MSGLWLLLTDPRLAARTCDECRAWVYDEKTRERVKRGGRDVARPKNVPTPCHQCPKQSPEQASQHELTAANHRTYETYLEVQATSGASLTGEQRRAGVLLRRLAIVHRVVREVETQNLLRAVAVGNVQRLTTGV